jgi:multidrug resistance efflux pump
LEQRIDTLVAEGKTAQQNYDNLRRQATLNQSGTGRHTSQANTVSQSDLDSAQRQVSNCANELDAAKRELDRIKVQAPRPEFAPNFQPLIPE